MKIILKKDVANLGEAGEIVEVKTGYAVNYLVPQGYAQVGPPSALKQHEETIRQRAHKEAKLVADAQAQAAKISAKKVKIEAKAIEDGKEITVDEMGIKKAGAVVYYANVDQKDGKLLTGTSRSVGVVGIADTIDEAEENCEKALKSVKCDHVFVRHDIGKKALVQQRVTHMQQLRSA